MKNMILSQIDVILIAAISFLCGVLSGSTISFVYWRKRVLDNPRRQKTAFLKIYFILLISSIWLVATLGEVLFNGPQVNILLHMLMGAVTGVVIGPDFAKNFGSVRMPLGHSSNSNNDAENKTEIKKN